jgi:NADH-quinone oxidoreductase subunit L
VLAAFSVLGGFIHLPLDSVLPGPRQVTEASFAVEWLPVLLSALGVGIAWFLFHQNRGLAGSLKNSLPGRPLHRFFGAAFGFDWLYDLLFKRPYLWFVHINRNDGVDVAISAIPAGFRKLNEVVARSQNGQIRWYAATVAAGACLVIAGVLFL